MSLTPGTRLGSYEIVSLIGAGGMGEVYRARDTRLKREVAIKILPSEFSADSDRLARFQREAELLAALNHPNIAQIHGVEEGALVLELVDGPTLGDRLVNGRIPLDETLTIARQIAEALEAAHDCGIVHRDLKPANIKLTSEGTVKVLDFGLAKPMDPVSARHESPSVSQSPTITSPAILSGGVLLGTVGYMSPEQARGKPADKRSDIWAFGCVLYEMLAGTPAFGGDDAAERLAFTLAREPEWASLPPNLHPTLRRLVRGCLERDRRRRISDMAVVRFALDEASSFPPSEELGSTPQRQRPRLSWARVRDVVATSVVTALVAASAAWFVRSSHQEPISRTTLSLPASVSLRHSSYGSDLVISPDGTRIIFVAGGEGRLYVRPIAELDPTWLGVTGTGPFTSPDGQWVGYFDGGLLKKVSITKGPPMTLAAAGGAEGGATWGADDTIIFGGFGTGSGLHRVPATGGEPSVLTTPVRPHEVDHLWPVSLPGGQAVLFTIVRSDGLGPGGSDLAVHDLRTGRSKVLVRDAGRAQYLPTGHLVYATSGNLHAVAFDLARLQIVGAPTPIIPGVVTKPAGAALFAVSDNGTLVYAAGSVGVGIAGGRGELVSVSRDGRATPLKLPVSRYREPRVSPDGKRLAVSDGGDIWTYDLAQGTRVRLTSDGAATRAIWTPDGSRLVFRSGALGEDMFSVAADRASRPEQLLARPGTQLSAGWSPDGAVLAFDELRSVWGQGHLAIAEGGTARALYCDPVQRAEYTLFGRRTMDRVCVE